MFLSTRPRVQGRQEKKGKKGEKVRAERQIEGGGKEYMPRKESGGFLKEEHLCCQELKCKEMFHVKEKGERHSTFSPEDPMGKRRGKTK